MVFGSNAWGKLIHEKLLADSVYVQLIEKT